jgi:hypothetical protein
MFSPKLRHMARASSYPLQMRPAINTKNLMIFLVQADELPRFWAIAIFYVFGLAGLLRKFEVAPL